MFKHHHKFSPIKRIKQDSEGQFVVWVCETCPTLEKRYLYADHTGKS